MVAAVEQKLQSMGYTYDNGMVSKWMSEDKKDLPGLYRAFGESFRMLDSWSAYMITSYEDAERYFGRKSDKNRKIYNGMLKTYFYQFEGPKPPKRREKR